MSELDSLLLSDDKVFYTLEGEGRYAGWPSVFMRLSKCNLTCAGFKSADSPHGCDSYISWSKSNKYTFTELFTLLESGGFIKNLKEGALLKITGGEPLLQQKALIEFIKAFAVKYEFVPQIDFETNGTLMPDPIWYEGFNATFTVSPKLSNNGDPVTKRYIPAVLRAHVELNSCFKFVVTDQSHVDEIMSKYVNEPQIQLPKPLIWLMPCCGSRQEQTDIAEKIAELCKKNMLKFSARLHLLIWNKALRV